MTHAQLKSFFKSLREPGWAVLIFLNVVLLCLALAFVALIFTQKIIWNRGPAAPTTTQITGSSGFLPVSLPPTHVYEVQPGDSLWLIAQNEVGQGERYVEIVHLNNLANPNQLEVGQSLVLPTDHPVIEVETVTPAPESELTPMATHVVQKGESLWSIASQYLGTPYAWPELYQANRHLIGLNPDLIYPGQELVLPHLHVSGK